MHIEHLNLYINENISFKSKFFLLMNILVSNKENNIYYYFIMILFHELQNLSIFFTKKVSVLKSKYLIDKILLQFEDIVRIKSLFYYDRDIYNILIYLISIYIFLFACYFLWLLNKMNLYTIYSRALRILNYLININLFIFQIVFYDSFTSFLCYGKEYNVYIKEVKCNQSNNKFPFLISFLSTLLFFFLMLVINLFYQDNFFLSQSPIKGIITYLNLYTQIICFINSFSLVFINEINHGTFFIWHIINGLFLLVYINKKIVYYNNIFYCLESVSFFIRFYASIYFYIFFHIDMDNKGLIFVVTSLIIAYIISIISINLRYNIIKSIPFNELKNKYTILFYLQFLIQSVNKINDESIRALLSGIIELHYKECTNLNCIVKVKKKKFYLPIINQWGEYEDNYKIDIIFLRHFVLSNILFFINKGIIFPELLINLSHYYLFEIGNICLSLFYYEKLVHLKLNVKEKFSVERLKICISNHLMNVLKKPNESCNSISELDTTLYYKYHDISEKFIEEIFNELSFTLEFWNFFVIKKNITIINFNQIFETIDKIRTTREKINNLWNKMFEIYSGTNIYFDLYLHFISNVNGDDERKNYLNDFQKKKQMLISTENLNIDYYNFLFNNETGIALVNGDLGNEGKIEKSNYKFADIFDMDPKFIIGKNIHDFMPRIFANEHKTYMNNFYNIGEKKIIEKKEMTVIGLDKNKNLLLLKIIIKIFPMINHSVLYCGILTLEQINDLILIDFNFNIQGMSKYLMNRLEFDNENLFQDINIPFYLICKNFLNYYKYFIKEKKIIPSRDLFSTLLMNDVKIDEKKNENKKQKEINDNIDIKEEMEIEYEMKVPNFLHQLSNLLKKKRERKENDWNKLDEKEEESDLLLDKRQLRKYDRKQTRKRTYKNNNNFNTVKYFTTNTIVPTNYSNFSKNLKDIIPNDFNEKSPSKSSLNGIRKINNYRHLFEKENYHEIIRLLDQDNINCEVSFTFNFAIEKYIFGNKHCYIIRCINHKKDERQKEIDFGSLNEHDSFLMYKIIKKKVLFLEKDYEINYDEKKMFELNIKNFNKISQYSSEFQENRIKSQNQIEKISKIFGKSNKDFHDNEIVSQVMNLGFNSQLSQIQKITEIREYILNKSSNLRTIKFLKKIPILWILNLLIFGFFIFLFFLYSLKEMKDVRIYNRKINILQIRIIQILNLIVDINIFNISKNISNNYFIDNETEFFLDLNIKGIKWYNDTCKSIEYIEKNFNRYFNSNHINIWLKLPMASSNDFPLQLTEYFALSLSESLYNAYYLLINQFILNGTLNIDKDEHSEIEYCYFYSIQNMINYNIPILNYFSRPFNLKLIEYNNNIDKLFDCFILVLFFSSLAIIGMYIITILITIYGYGTGISKMINIRQDCVSEIIMNIENYSIQYKRKLSLYENSIKVSNFSENLSVDDTKTKRTKSYRISNFIPTLSENRKIINLKISLKIYIIVCLDIIVLTLISLNIFFLIRNQIKLNENMLISFTYICSEFLYTSTKLLNMKCLISNISIMNMDYGKIENHSTSLIFYNTINKSPELYYFYYFEYLNDICASLYEKNSIDYNICKNDSDIQLLNNSQGIKDYLLREIEKIIYQFNKSNLWFNEYNTFYILSLKEYYNILKIYKTFYMPIIDKLNNVFENSLNNIIKKKQRIIMFLFLLLLIWNMINIFNTYIFLIPKLRKYTIISRDFLRIIPINYILKIPSLIKWMETIEGDKI